jgi:maleylacetoacetate isomerase
MKLYSYWRSQASYRVRIALRLKGLVAETVSLDLLKGDQFDPAYTTLNPEMVVPTLLDGDGPPLMQSLAILEYLEEKYPQSPLLPEDVLARGMYAGSPRCSPWTRIPLSSRACENISNRNFISMSQLE